MTRSARLTGRSAACGRPGTREHRIAKASLIALSLVSAFVCGCSVTNGVQARSPRTSFAGSSPLTAADRVLVLPLRDRHGLPANGLQVMCPLTGEYLDAGEVPKDTGIHLSSILFDELEARGVPLVPYEDGFRSFPASTLEAHETYDPSFAVRLGEEAGASKVILGVVTCYEERSGSGWGSRSAAAVAFSLALVDVSSGSVTHKLRFSRRQTALASNLFALPLWWREGFRWWTRHQVAEHALGEAAEALVDPRTAGNPWSDMPAPSARHLGEWRTDAAIAH